MQSSLSLTSEVVVVALIAIAIRWLSTARGSNLPRTRDGLYIYEIKWQWRLFGLICGVFWIVIFAWSWHDLGHPDGLLTAMTATFVLIIVSVAIGSVITSQTGITKRTIWRSTSFPWKEVTEIRLHKKQGGAIELRSGSRKMVVGDSRFDAREHLLNEIQERTQVHPIEGP
jgi:hypothetical protein